MLRYVFILSTLLLLTACSELKIVGKAAIRELSSDGISVEQTSYQYHQKLAQMK